MENIKYTIYIASYNYGRYLQEAIESVLRQTVESCELIIVDDNSIDNTSSVMSLYSADERIRLFRTEGIGLPAVCNFSLEHARGQYIIRLDGDDVFDENILLVLGNFLDKNTDHCMVFPDYFLIDEKGEVVSHERREKLYESNHFMDAPANGACSLVRTEVLRNIGGYREDLGAQDGYDLWNKLKGRYKCANINLPLFYYRKHTENLTLKTHRILFARQAIKRDNAADKIAAFHPVIAVIPCRRRYDFVENLWKQSANGKTLLERNIEKCLKLNLLDRVIVTSDNPESRAVTEKFDDDRLLYFDRDGGHTIRSISIVKTLNPIISKLDPDYQGITLMSYLHAPFISEKTLEEAITTLALNDASCAIGVEEVTSRVFKRTAHGMEALNPPKGISSDFDTLYIEESTALATKNKNIKVGSLTGSSIANFIVPSDECFIVDSDMKLRMARSYSEELC